MKRLMLAVAGASMVALPAQAMTVAQFLAKAKALQALGPLAYVSPDLAALRGEIVAIRNAYRSDLATARAAHRKPHSCPPPVEVTMTPAQLIAELERIPQARRTISMKAAFYDYMRRRYPCR